MARLALIAATLGALAVGSQAFAQEEGGANTPRHSLAQAAGYRALYTCTGLFTAGIQPARLESDIFGNYDGQGRIGPQNVTIDQKDKTVSVTYAPDMPPRVAVWRPVLGCVQLPVGARAGTMILPRLPNVMQAPNLDGQPWPQGDQNAVVKLPADRQAAVDAVVARAFDNKTYKGTTWAVIVVKDGKIIAERYDRGYDMHTPQRTNSAAKSVAATLVGIAAKQGLFDINRPAPLSEWRRAGDPRSRITINDLLHMSSGLYTEAAGNPQDELYQSGAAAAERSALNVMDAVPGERWVYAGSDTILAVRSIRAVLNDDQRFLAYPFRELLWKIGMTRTTPETDWNGDFLLSGQMWSTARDFARFGLLYINDGMWNGERILPQGWTQYVATPAKDQPKGRDGRGYGAQFWLFGAGQGMPAGSYAAAGARGQYIMVVPSEGVVVVRRGFDATGDNFLIPRFSADVIKAVNGR
jgi:CubicO group peptidase (beta-lactamase class C family)